MFGIQLEHEAKSTNRHVDDERTCFLAADNGLLSRMNQTISAQG